MNYQSPTLFLKTDIQFLLGHSESLKFCVCVSPVLVNGCDSCLTLSSLSAMLCSEMKILTININKIMLMSTIVLKQILCDYTMREYC